MEKYRPSNGSEGDDFTSRFCDICKNGNGDTGCDIQNRTMAFDLSDPEYPSEWVYGLTGNPICTAFE